MDVRHRCVVPFTSFVELHKSTGGSFRNRWFTQPDQELAFFIGIWTQWTSLRKLKEGEVTANLFGFLATDPNAEVAAVHPKAMPVILRTREEISKWLHAPDDDAMMLQRSLPDASFSVTQPNL